MAVYYHQRQYYLTCTCGLWFVNFMYVWVFDSLIVAQLDLVFSAFISLLPRLKTYEISNKIVLVEAATSVLTSEIISSPIPIQISFLLVVRLTDCFKPLEGVLRAVGCGNYSVTAQLPWPYSGFRWSELLHKRILSSLQILLHGSLGCLDTKNGCP